MASHTLTESASLAGVSRRTIQRYVRNGKLSSKKNHKGNPTIETSELIRVFGELSHPVTGKNENVSHPVTLDSELIKEAILEAQEPLLEKIEQLHKKIANLENRIEYKPEKKAPKKDNQFSSIMEKLKSKI